MKKTFMTRRFLFLILFAFLVLPGLSAYAQESETESVPTVIRFKDVPGPTIYLERPYRYANKRCDVSFQLPEPPSTEIVWGRGEEKLPFSFIKDPGYGEFGEKLTYKIRSFDGSKSFDFTGYCFYPDKSEISQIVKADIENSLSAYQKEHKLKNVSVAAQDLPKEVSVGKLTGYHIDDKTKNVTAHYLQIMKTANSVLILTTKYSADQPQFDDFLKLIQSSMILEE